MLKTRDKSSDILNDVDVDVFVKNIYDNNSKLKKTIDGIINIYVNQQKHIYYNRTNRINKTSTKLFIKKLEFDSLDILYKVIGKRVNRILRTFGRFMLHIFRPTCNYKQYPHLCNKTYRRLNKFKIIPRAIILV